jgi:DMSO/TMAO reductase YedYZ molybdopterin-dependent catalytic subunit
MQDNNERSEQERRLIVTAALKEMPDVARRLFLRQGLTLGGLTLLTGCSISNNASVASALRQVSKFNDRAQAWLFDPNRLAPTYPRSMITQPFPFNAFYTEAQAPVVDGESYRLELGGMIADKRPWTLEALNRLPQESQITRHICVEGWSAIGEWGGVRFSEFLHRIGADTSAKYVGFKCADNYYQSIDMPTKLGYKNPKHIMSIYLTNRYPGGYWEDQGYNWFGGS